MVIGPADGIWAEAGAQNAGPEKGRSFRLLCPNLFTLDARPENGVCEYLSYHRASIRSSPFGRLSRPPAPGMGAGWNGGEAGSGLDVKAPVDGEGLVDRADVAVGLRQADDFEEEVRVIRCQFLPDQRVPRSPVVGGQNGE